MKYRHRPRRNHGARITEVEIDGMPLVTLEHDLLRVGVLAGKGADVVELLYKPLDVDFCWATPAPLSNPAREPVGAPDATATYHDHYPGGWQEIVPNGGPPSQHAGAEYGLHGEAFLVPWDYEIVVDTPQEIAVRFRVRTRRAPLLVERTMSLRAGEPLLRVEERLVNESDVEQRAMWGQHVVFGAPYLQPGMRIRVPEGAQVLPHAQPLGADGNRRLGTTEPFAWPHAPGAGGGTIDLSVVPDRGTPTEMLYLTDLPEGWYEIGPDPDGEDRRPGFRLDWDARVLPHLWMWQELGASTGYPWHGRGYVVGLEPFSSHPTDGLAAAVENGTALRIAPREQLELSWSAAVLPNGIGRSPA